MKYIILCGGIEDEYNYSLPKPLNYIYGKHMIEYVIENIPSDEIFILYNIFLDGFNFREIIINKFKQKVFHFSCIDYLTRGPVETAYIGFQQFQHLIENDNDENIVFIDDDSMHNLMHIKDSKFETPFIGYGFDDSNNTDLAFIKIDEKLGRLIEIAEKEKISNLYCCGIYGFNNIQKFLEMSKILLQTNSKTKGEFYFSTLYSSILNEGSNIIETFYIEKTQHIGSFKLTDISVNVKKPKLRICFDLDNTLVTYPTIINDYNSVKPITKNINLLNFFREQGHEIIIYTARRMTTHNNNIGKVIKDIALTTINTLEKFNILYDELIFGKPIADIYIDDRALNPYNTNISHYGFIFDSEEFLHNKIAANKYNNISFVDNRIIKTGPSQFVRGELFYYQNIPQEISLFFPKLLHSSINTEIENTTIEIEHIKGIPLFYLYKNKLITTKIIDDLFTILNKMHSLHIDVVNKPSDDNIKNNYFDKLEKRFVKKEDYPFEDATMVYNELMKELSETYSPEKVPVIHGDFWFSNIILTYEDAYKMIDMKGQLDGILTVGGDRYYDYGKFYQSILGYDLILNDCKIDSVYIKDMNDYFISKCHSIGLNINYLKSVTKSLIFGTFHSIDKPKEIKNNIWSLLKSIKNLKTLDIELEDKTPKYDCIISINIHEKFDFLLKQLKNIQENVFCNYAVILNCNDYMYEECNKRAKELPYNVYIHDTILNKNVNHGSLTEGIYNNMVYALNKFNFDFFIVASSRNMFTNELKQTDLIYLVDKLKRFMKDDEPWEEKKNSWRWPNLSNTLLVKHYIDKNKQVYACPHEGVVYTKNGCKKIIEFLYENQEIKKDLFQFNDAIEETALQTISMNSGENFYYIGNGVNTETEKIGKNDPDNGIFKFMYKIKRE